MKILDRLPSEYQMVMASAVKAMTRYIFCFIALQFFKNYEVTQFGLDQKGISDILNYSEL